MSDVSAPADPAKQTPSLAPYWFPDTRSFLAVWMSVSSFIILVLNWWRPAAPDNQMLNTLISLYVGTGFITVINWWVGSSKSSQDKDATIANAVKGP